MNSLTLKTLSYINKVANRILVFVFCILMIAFDCYIVKHTLCKYFGYQFIENNNKTYVTKNIYGQDFVKDEWIKKGNKWYYVKNDHTIARDEVYEIDGKKFYFDNDGVLITNKKDYNIDGRLYNINKNGVIISTGSNIEMSYGNVCVMGDSNFSKEKYNNNVTFFYENIDKKIFSKTINLSETGAGFCSGFYDIEKSEYKAKPYYIMVEFVPKDTDTLLIFSSFNDVNGNYDIGKITDKEIGTICGSFNYVIERAKTINPKMKIIVFSPVRWLTFGKESAKKQKSDKYVSTLKELCNENNLTFYDLYNKSMEELSDTNYMSDKIHINSETHDKFVKDTVLKYLNIN